MTLIYLGIGSNLGDRLENLNQSIKSLAPEVRVVQLSSIYKTEPWGYQDQPAFLNQVCEAETSLTPLRLLNKLKRIEKEVGRKETFRYGPRIIDLDILFYGSLVKKTARLEIPHPCLHDRAFVLVPLVEIAPNFVHPVFGETIHDLLLETDPKGVEVFCSAS